ncbi:DNA repair protein RecN [Tetragenococcus halophilus]|uniref:DNA repair protein RecN n=1 Tax=Tetragenococcus halophilus TaxID=51669 RepID=UPI000CAA3E42|nr:DNA repair protein RecN [Tetragenococcus halophilus]RQD29293.1 DNA repair protein RecN [Tetragenococcus halophilus subsp. halophilus DSM 20339]GBD58840.1 DNA repair protein RecN [Tetragenococcus halophilus subsp. halophilus]GFK24987.1 DNA repair protein RecN [Tetragenococcus halophilus]GFK29537.1 DNA repair protein RecN [Tetragenococcus halophilus]GLL52001.1 DNA repair protein RecN [Tetragenococcus halophilus]
MLLELSIENFAIIKQLHLTFHKGMTALTGETGAGKSIIIDAMGLLAGGRGSTDYIRQGKQKCVLEGLFELPKHSSFKVLLDDLGIDQRDELLIIQRDITSSGKSICRVNGRIVTLGNLKRIGAYLVDIQGQNEHQDLLQAEKHLQLVDSFGSQSFKDQLADYQKKYDAYRELEKRVRAIQENEQSYIQRIDMLNFQKKEIEEAGLQIDEEEKLVEERDKLANFQKIVDAFAKSHEILAGESGNSLDGIGEAAQEIQEVAYLDKEYEQINENVQNAYYLLQDAAGEVSNILDQMELDEGRLEEVNARLEVIRQLKRKYGESIAAVLSYDEKISAELEQVDVTGNKLEEMQTALDQKHQNVWEIAESLHTQRKQIAQKLEKDILQELSDLYLENTQFEVRFFEEKKELNRNGLDQLEFYLTTNPGEPLKPLAKVASGGELSRMLLALKSIFSKAQEKTSIVFDEVDTGVSGRVAQAIAEKISGIAYGSQVLCITHLPQVAAAGDYQYLISKEVQSGRTKTTVQEIDTTERVQEIARMLSGAEITDLTMENAKEMLTQAGKIA